MNCPRGADEALEAVLGEARLEVGGEESDSEVGGSSAEGEEEESVKGGGGSDIDTSEVGSIENVEEGNVPKDDDHEE